MDSQSLINRKPTKAVKVGNVTIGGGAPISVQSMIKSHPHNPEKIIKKILELEQIGCELIRIAIPDEKAAKFIPEIKKNINIPLIADIHFKSYCRSST